MPICPPSGHWSYTLALLSLVFASSSNSKVPPTKRKRKGDPLATMLVFARPFRDEAL